MQRLKRFPISALVFIFLIGLLPSLGYSQIQLDDPLLVFYFPLNEGKGDIIKDLGPNQLEGELEGGPAWVDSVDKKFGTCLSFIDGKEQSGFVADVPALDLGESDTTLAAWVKTGKEVGQGFVYIKWDGGGWYIKLRDKKLYTRYHIPAPVGFGAEIPSKTEIADDVWHHVASMRTNKETVQLYIDGKLDHKDDAGSAPGSANTPANLEIGRFKEERFWDGEFDELFLMKRNLTNDELQLLMDGQFLAVESKGKLPLTWGSLKSARK